jgi:hypothetical protein
MSAPPATPLKPATAPPNLVTPSPRARPARAARPAATPTPVVTPSFCPPCPVAKRVDPLRAIPQILLEDVVGRLAARDVAAIRETAPGLLDAADVPRVCLAVGGDAYAAVLRAAEKSGSPRKGGAAPEPPSPRVAPREPTSPRLALAALRVAELERIADGVADAREPSGEHDRGYWLSKSWAQQARRYYESHRALLLRRAAAAAPGSAPRGARRRGRGRSGSSEQLPPWPDCNAEIVCEHGFLSPKVAAPRSKRVLVDRSAWRAIALRFPLSTKLKASVAAECRCCARLVADRAEFLRAQKASAERERVLRNREVDECAGDAPGHWWARPRAAPPAPAPTAAAAPPPPPPRESAAPQALAAALDRAASAGPSGLLRGLLSKERARRGLPHHRLAAPGPGAPLTPGKYHLVPRPWLRRWRRSLKVAASKRPGPPNTADCLCAAHGLPVVPPHVRAFLRGDEAELLPRGGDAARDHRSCEIVTGDEWTALNSLFPVDFAVSFDVAAPKSGGLGAELAWSSEPCGSCDVREGADFDVTFRPRDYKRQGRCRPDAEGW